MHIGILLVIIIVAIIILPRLRVRKITNPHEEELVQRCFGDQEMAERLINYELKRNPKLSRTSATRYAIASLERDNS